MEGKNPPISTLKAHQEMANKANWLLVVTLFFIVTLFKRYETDLRVVSIFSSNSQQESK